VNLELPEREYSKKGEHMCCKDGYVAFFNGELICGRLGKVSRSYCPRQFLIAKVGRLSLQRLGCW
jgi:hypothetical protein